MMSALRAWLLRALTLRRRWLGVVIACVIWLIWMMAGFWALVLLIILVGLGYAIGAAVEHGITWRDLVEKLLANRENR